MHLSTINAPSYKRKRIGTLEALAYPLGLNAAALEDLARRADAMYRLAKEIVKPDGSVRHTYDAFKPLKVVHGRIKREILDQVAFPLYLTGSIKGRDYKVNATLHSRAKIVINEDISGFFPATTSQHVFDIWHRFFGFSEAVARCLTDLTTYHGELPQGAITSPALANLVFWRREPQLQAEFAAKGWTYSRYVDDIAVSSTIGMAPHQKTEAIRKVYGLLSGYGYKPKRNKHEITTAAQRMVVTKLSINAKPGLAQSERDRIRAAVHEVERLVSSGNSISTDSGVYAKAMGRVTTLARFHPGEAAPLRQRLLRAKQTLQPLLSPSTRAP
ncbi:reverse transcriptase family protein [Bordetella trematum]|uniref:reverse transcriptase family protein n=1 Tax=Bordetella trematum TaxID=123899 RepID=UPI00068BC774|nr:reverse transcriptase family protein [Bordetella trematum]